MPKTDMKEFGMSYCNYSPPPETDMPEQFTQNETDKLRELLSDVVENAPELPELRNAVRLLRVHSHRDDQYGRVAMWLQQVVGALSRREK